jgi:radical SAM superfamily enzyme YgiQ (UPF0313 family)
VPSRPPGEAPLLRFTLPDGRPATLLLGEASTVLSVGDALVSSWDLAGRPYALVRETGTYRRGLDGRLLWKREAGVDGPRVRRRLSATEGEHVVEAARQEAEAVASVLAPAGNWPHHARPHASQRPARRSRRAPGIDAAHIAAAVPGLVPPRNHESTTLEDLTSAARQRLASVVALDDAALRHDAERFLAASGPVGILPPDQYLALVVRVTEGCSWNACTFCLLYRDVPFRWKRPEELVAHLAALREYFGPSIALRRSVFLGDANALCLARDRLLPLVEIVARERAGAPLYSFVDTWTGQRKGVPEWREYAALGLKRVYVGLETGDPGLLAWLKKPGSSQDAVDIVCSLHDAGVAAGVIVLLGAGGERFADDHLARTTEALTAMGLGPDDFVYFSEYVDEAGPGYGPRTDDTPDLQPLSPARDAELRRAILAGLRPRDPARPPRSATYDIREFVY